MLTEPFITTASKHRQDVTPIPQNDGPTPLAVKRSVEVFVFLAAFNVVTKMRWPQTFYWATGNQ